MDYIIGAGAIIESGQHAGITPATLHAHVDAALAARVEVAAIDFESTSPESLRRLIVAGRGWDAARFRRGVSEPLRKQCECSLADVLLVLAREGAAREVHLFAHWLPDEATCREMLAQGVRIVVHPLESIEEAAIVAGQRHRRWQAA